MNLIASADSAWGIGNKNSLLFDIPQDKKYFKEKTTGKAIIMGRKTFDSLPVRPLPDRNNFILTHDSSFSHDGKIHVCCSMAELNEQIRVLDSKDIFIIGGAEIYKLFLPLCDTAYITRIYSQAIADKYIENLEASNEWRCVSASDMYYHNNTGFRFTVYKRQ